MWMLWEINGSLGEKIGILWEMNGRLGEKM